jgi:cadmium resistance protein CadD (predicted permease)
MPEFLQDVMTALALAAASFISTNVDNLLIAATLARGNQTIRDVVGGYAMAIAVLLLIAWSFTAISRLFPPTALGWFGLLPIALGLRMLLKPAPADASMEPVRLSARAVALVLLANSADTLAVIGPLFAESEGHVVVALTVGYLLSAAVMLFFISRFSVQVRRELPLMGAAERAVPFLMIAIGVYVLVNTGTDLV